MGAKSIETNSLDYKSNGIYGNIDVNTLKSISSTIDNLITQKHPDNKDS